MRAHNNQPKVGRIVGIYMVEAARRAMTIGEDAVPSYRKSDFEGKKLIKRNSSWLEADANQQLQTTTNHINAGAMGKIRLGCATIGKRRGGAI